MTVSRIGSSLRPGASGLCRCSVTQPCRGPASPYRSSTCPRPWAAQMFQSIRVGIAEHTSVASVRTGARPIPRAQRMVRLSALRAESSIELVQNLLHVHIAPMTADKTYTRSLSRAEARAAVIVAKVISTATAFSVTAPASPESAGPAKDASTRAYDPGDLHPVILLRFAASALQPVPFSQNSADSRGSIRKARRKTLDLSLLDITATAGLAADVLATLDWRGVAAVVGLNLDEVEVLNLGCNGMTGMCGNCNAYEGMPALRRPISYHLLPLTEPDSDVSRIDLACLPNLTVIDISQQPISAIPLRWLITPARAAVPTPSRLTLKHASGPCADAHVPQTQTSTSIRGIRLRARKTACLLTDTSRVSIADNNQEIMRLSIGRIRHDALSVALRAGQRDSLDGHIESSVQALRNEAGRRADGAGRGSGSNQGARQTGRPRLSASFAAVQRAACGAKSLLLIAAIIAAEQYLNTSARMPSVFTSPWIDRPDATRLEAQESPPSDGGMQPVSGSCSGIGIETELELEPYRALPPQLYKLITTAYRCDLCARIAFPGVGDSNPQFIASDIRVGGMADPVYFAYPADTRHPNSMHRERGERSDRHRFTTNGSDDNGNNSAESRASEGVITRALIQAMGNAASSTSASASAVEHVRVKGRVCCACWRALVVLAKK